MILTGVLGVRSEQLLLVTSRAIEAQCDLIASDCNAFNSEDNSMPVLVDYF